MVVTMAVSMVDCWAEQTAEWLANLKAGLWDYWKVANLVEELVVQLVDRLVDLKVDD